MAQMFGKMFWRISVVSLCLAIGPVGSGAKLQAQSNPAAIPAAESATSSAPEFDVATIKPHASGARASWMGVQETADGFNGSMATLTMLMQYAYGLRNENQVLGVPDWARADRFDMQAKMSEADIAELKKLSPADSKTRRQLMLRALLVERFQLKVHFDTKQTPVYELVVAKSPTKLKDAATDTDPQLGMGKDGKPWTGLLRFMKDTSVAQGSYSMSSLADLLSAPVAGVEPSGSGQDGADGKATTLRLAWSVYTAQVWWSVPLLGCRRPPPSPPNNQRLPDRSRRDRWQGTMLLRFLAR